MSEIEILLRHQITNMKLFSTALFGFIALFLLSADTDDKTPFPSFKVKKLNGEVVDLIDYAQNGKITIVSFWATWCKPCVNELNTIADYYEEWQDEYDLELIAISVDDQSTKARIKGVVNSNSWDYEILHDVNGESYRTFNFQNVPYTALVDTDGNIVYKHNKYSPGDEEELLEKIKEIVEGSK